MDPLFFTSEKAFRQWLKKYHNQKTELLVGFYKVKTGKPTLSWSQSVEQALCFGWIDGRRTSIDEDRYQIRFTPRRKTSVWSAVNIKKIEELTQKGLMHPAGLEIFSYRQESKSRIYSFENEEMKLSPVFEKLFKKNKKAWQYFQALAAGYKKASLNWVMSARQEATRLKRLNELIADCAASTNRWKDNKYAARKTTNQKKGKQEGKSRQIVDSPLEVNNR